MELKPTSTVILPLEEYERMKQEIADLKKQVQKQTIIQHVSIFDEFKTGLGILALSAILGFIYYLVLGHS